MVVSRAALARGLCLLAIAFTPAAPSNNKSSTWSEETWHDFSEMITKTWLPLLFGN
jgi:hypothetical protein